MDNLDRSIRTLKFLRARFIHQHGENENYDYMHGLSKIIRDLEALRPGGDIKERDIGEGLGLPVLAISGAKPRLSWDERMLALAAHWCQYSTCLRKHVGAVLFDPDTRAIISMGYNDTRPKTQNCGDGGCAPCKGPLATSLYIRCACRHSESNALLLAAGRGARTAGAVLACTHQPCESCENDLRMAGITRAIWPEGEESYA